MRPRTIFSRVAQTAFPVWGFLGLAGLAVAAGTGTMGERALLNRTGPSVRADAARADREAGRNLVVGGARALLNRTPEAEPAAASTRSGEPRSAASVAHVDGPRALQGVAAGAAEPAGMSRD
jgi:hypothetical protein